MATINTASKQAELVQFILLPRFNMATLTTMIEPMRIANYLSTHALYHWQFLSRHGGAVQASNDMVIACDELASDKIASGKSPASYIVLLGSWGAERYSDEKLTSWLRGQARHGIFLIGVEIGAYIFARAGLLTGKKATTHWSLFAGFAETFPQIEPAEQMFTIDHNIMTCAGGMAGVDLMLHCIEQTHDHDLAREVAGQMLHHFRCDAHYPQRPGPQTAAAATHPVIQQTIAYLETRIEDSIVVPDICKQLGIPQRQLERLFNKHVGCTIVQFCRLMKLQYARTLLVSTNMTIREISVATGFNSMSYFSSCFTRTFGRKPSQYRRAWPDEENAPNWPGTTYAVTHNEKKAKQEKATCQTMC
ncbi:MAG: GlxA family transcriptional regulator [Alphaproteobacteria bacterium]